MSAASYRLLAASGGQLEAGRGEVTLDGGVLELHPAGQAPLRVPSARITAVAEPAPFTVLVTLADGTALELSQLGRMRTQLLAELRDAQATVAAAESGAVGEAARFSATVAGSAVDLHVFEDAVLVVAGQQVSRLAFAFISDVRVSDYTVYIERAGMDPVAVIRLGRRTDEFAGLLAERVRAAATRTSAFLGSLLPGLDPLALRTAAGLLRDGVAVSAAVLDAVHPDLSATLLRVATLPGRYPALAGLAGADLAIGFRQLTSVRRSAVGVTPWQYPSVTPHFNEHETPGGRFGSGFGGMLGAGVMAGIGPGGPFGGGPGGYGGGYGGGYAGPGGYGALGGYWAFRALGAAGNAGPAGAPAPPGPPAWAGRGPLIPETEDLAGLTVSGSGPTVLAFALLVPGRGGDPVVYEALNQPEARTYAYRAGGPDPRARVNQALDDAGFAVGELRDAGSGDLTAAYRQDAAASPLGRALVAVIEHDDSWTAQVGQLLA